jgi:hypothetical protein
VQWQVTVNILFSYKNYTDLHFVTPLLLLKNIGNNVLDHGSPTDVFSLVFTNACEKKAPFQVSTAMLSISAAKCGEK